MNTDIRVKAQVLEYMQKHRGGLTVKECIDKLGTTELRKIVSDLKCAGWVIEDMWETSTNRYGQTVKFKRYFLLGKKKGE